MSILPVLAVQFQALMKGTTATPMNGSPWEWRPAAIRSPGGQGSAMSPGHADGRPTVSQVGGGMVIKAGITAATAPTSANPARRGAA